MRSHEHTRTQFLRTTLIKPLVWHDFASVLTNIILSNCQTVGSLLQLQLYDTFYMTKRTITKHYVVVL